MKSMNQWIIESMTWTSESMGPWINESVNKRVNESHWTNETMSQWISESMCRWIGCAKRRTMKFCAPFQVCSARVHQSSQIGPLQFQIVGGPEKLATPSIFRAQLLFALLQSYLAFHNNELSVHASHLLLCKHPLFVAMGLMRADYCPARLNSALRDSKKPLKNTTSRFAKSRFPLWKFRLLRIRNTFFPCGRNPCKTWPGSRILLLMGNQTVERPSNFCKLALAISFCIDIFTQSLKCALVRYGNYARGPEKLLCAYARSEKTLARSSGSHNHKDLQNP